MLVDFAAFIFVSLQQGAIEFYGERSFSATYSKAVPFTFGDLHTVLNAKLQCYQKVSEK